MRTLRVCILLIGFLFGVSAQAADPAPLAAIKNVTDQMLTELDRHISEIKHNDRLVYNLVERIVVPHVDLVAMSRAVVGREYWQSADAATQQNFITEFKHYVIRTYSSAMQSYDGEKIQFYPMRDYAKGQSRAQVNSDLLQKNGPAIQIQYRMSLQSDKWLVYDFSVDGVSIVKNSNSQFSSTLRQGGLSKLVQELQARNRG